MRHCRVSQFEIAAVLPIIIQVDQEIKPPVEPHLLFRKESSIALWTLCLARCVFEDRSHETARREIIIILDAYSTARAAA